MAACISTNMSTVSEPRCAVELGFTEKRDAWALKSKYFPSKIGGKPAWLHLSDVPCGKRLACKNCGEPCVFLLQVYAPRDDVDSAFHRTLFVFVCVTPDCANKHDAGSFIVLRSQLPKENSFYSSEPPVESPDTSGSPSAEDFCKICAVCGALGDKTCSKCHSRHYCSKSHQILDWRDGHKARCNSQCTDGCERTSAPLFPEYELVTETEDDACDDDEDCKTDEERLADYRQYLTSHPECSSGGGDLADLNKMAATCKDKAFWKFKMTIAKAPDQVLRYSLGGMPLLVASRGGPQSVPCCSCGSERQFEFQVLPQLLNSITEPAVDSLDWGTLLVYTCKASCDGEPYREEYLWKQNFSEE
uniref:Pre-rRNA-processing protein TSR4 n=1 Tax=Rhipicephalus appendiculatus TaxID=34631 RepID=A0A131YHP9_RHIAP